MSVPEHLDTVVLSGRLRQTNVLTRLEVMYSQLALAFTFCRIAETEVTFGDLKHARRVVAKTRLACNSLAEGLENRIQSIESRLVLRRRL